MSDAYSQVQQSRPDKGIGSDRPEWLGRAQMSTSLSPLLAPMLSSAAMRTVCDDAATLTIPACQCQCPCRIALVAPAKMHRLSPFLLAGACFTWGNQVEAIEEATPWP